MIKPDRFYIYIRIKQWRIIPLYIFCKVLIYTRFNMRALKLTILIFFVCGEIFSTPVSIMTASQGFGYKKISKTENDTSVVNMYTRKALSYISKPLKVEYIKANIDTAESICEKENIEFPSLLHLARAEYFFVTNDYRNASQEATIAMKKSKSFGETKVLIMTMNFLGRYSLRTGFFKESIDYYQNSIALARKSRIKGYIRKNYDGIADVYEAIGNQKEYRNTLQLLINESFDENDSAGLESGYFRLGTSFTNPESNYNAADSILRKCYKIALIRKDTAFAALSLANIGWNYYLQNKYDLAVKSYNMSLNYSVPAKRYSNAANALGNLGTIYRDIGDTEKSIKYYLKSIEQGKLAEDYRELSWVYDDMSQMYIRKKDTSNAYKSFVLFKKYSDANILKTNTKGLSDARIKYEADTHSKEVELLSLKLGKQRLMIYGYTGFFVLCLTIGILLYSRSRINAKRRLSEMNRKISEVTQANLRQQMNPHFIFNTLNSIQYYMYQHDKLATNNYLTKFSSLMRKVLENSQHTSVPLRDELDALKLYLELEMIRFKDKFDYQINIDEEIDTIMYKVPTMLIQPYVENSICHGLMPAEGKGLVKIDLKLEKEYISCIIEDNGIGREAAQEKKRKSENNHNSLGTQIISSRLDLVNALYGTSLKTIYTDLKNKDGEPEGTRVEIHIPIMS
jgi:two-component system, LytTR family, sensor kinase